MKWIKNYSWEKVEKDVDRVWNLLWEKLGVKKLGVVGFCWGSYGVLKLSSTGKVAAGISFHPSHSRLTGLYGDDESSLLKAVQCPQLFVPAGNDPESCKEGGLAQKIFNEKSIGKECQFKEFPEMQHGWVPRGDLTDPKVARDVRAALDLGSKFFAKHL